MHLRSWSGIVGTCFFVFGFGFVCPNVQADNLNPSLLGVESARDIKSTPPGSGEKTTSLSPTTIGNVDLLVALGDGGGFGYGYGNFAWVEMTAAIDAAMHSVTTTTDLENLPFMLQFDALWVDQRWTGGTLTPTELSNLADYIATGRRVVFIGENNSWLPWNTQILGLVGGTPAGDVSGLANTIAAIDLTTGVSQVNLLAEGSGQPGGIELFDLNFAQLWNDQVLTVLSVNAMSEAWFDADNATFFTNVASWLAEQPVGDCPACQIEAGLEAGTAKGAGGDTISVPIEAFNSPTDVDSLGFEVHFDATKLAFTGCDFTGTFLENWTFKDCNSSQPGVVVIGGFTTDAGIPLGSTGPVVHLNFEVVACEEGQQCPLELMNFVDDIAPWESCAGCFTCVICDGDVNNDDQVTPADPQIVFACFLGQQACTPTEVARGDINRDGSLTPEDAQCIFNKFLQRPPEEQCACFLP